MAELFDKERTSDHVALDRLQVRWTTYHRTQTTRMKKEIDREYKRKEKNGDAVLLAGWKGLHEGLQDCNSMIRQFIEEARREA